VSDFFFGGSSVFGSPPIEPSRDPVSRTVAKRPMHLTLRSTVVLEKSAWTLLMSHLHVLMIDVLASFAKRAMLIVLFSLMELWGTV